MGFDTPDHEDDEHARCRYEIENLQNRIAELEAELAKANDHPLVMREGVAKMSHRRCFACKHEAYYLLSTAPYCICEKCGSQDTRLIRAPEGEMQLPLFAPPKPVPTRAEAVRREVPVARGGVRSEPRRQRKNDE